MLKNLFLVLGAFIVIFSVPVSANYCTPNTKFGRQLKLKNENFNIALVRELKKNNTLTTLNGTLFWTVSSMKKTTEVVAPETVVLDIQNNQDVKLDDQESFVTEENLKQHSNSNKSTIVEPAISAVEPAREVHYSFPQKIKDFFPIKEIIILPRNNCDAEIAVHENRDTKLTIIFGHLQNNSFGRCCLTLNGRENSMLGVIISNVHLYQNKTQEVLKVIVGNRYSAFVLKEYYGSKDYEPLLLTEAHKVYLVLHYKAEYTAPSQDCSYFNLEVFPYQKYEKNIHHNDDHKDNYNHKNSAPSNRAHDVYSSKKKKLFHSLHLQQNLLGQEKEKRSKISGK